MIALLAACARGTGPATAPRSTPALQASYPALAWVPADASDVVTGRVGAVARGLRESVAPLVGLAAPQGALDALLRRLTGLDPLSERDLATAGIAVDRTAALFSSGLWPTLALPVEDPAALTDHLQPAWPLSGVRLVEREAREATIRWAEPGRRGSCSRRRALRAGLPGGARAGGGAARARTAAPGRPGEPARGWRRGGRTPCGR